MMQGKLRVVNSAYLQQEQARVALAEKIREHYPAAAGKISLKLNPNINDSFGQIQLTLQAVRALSQRCFEVLGAKNSVFPRKNFQALNEKIETVSGTIGKDTQDVQKFKDKNLKLLKKKGGGLPFLGDGDNPFLSLKDVQDRHALFEDAEKESFLDYCALLNDKWVDAVAHEFLAKVLKEHLSVLKDQLPQDDQHVHITEIKAKHAKDLLESLGEFSALKGIYANDLKAQLKGLSQVAYANYSDLEESLKEINQTALGNMRLRIQDIEDLSKKGKFNDVQTVFDLFLGAEEQHIESEHEILQYHAGLASLCVAFLEAAQPDKDSALGPKKKSAKKQKKMQVSSGEGESELDHKIAVQDILGKEMKSLLSGVHTIGNHVQAVHVECKENLPVLAAGMFD